MPRCWLVMLAARHDRGFPQSLAADDGTIIILDDGSLGATGSTLSAPLSHSFGQMISISQLPNPMTATRSSSYRDHLVWIVAMVAHRSGSGVGSVTSRADCLV